MQKFRHIFDPQRATVYEEEDQVNPEESKTFENQI
jgi:hypothetical protein